MRADDFIGILVICINVLNGSSKFFTTPVLEKYSIRALKTNKKLFKMFLFI